ncbi:geraniol synthase, partial [Striga asiatica]
DTKGLLSLYEASHLGAKGETILQEAKEFSKTHLQSMKITADDNNIGTDEALELPRHLRMEGLEARLYIQQYAKQQSHEPALLELAVMDYNRVQVQHQSELSKITRWGKPNTLQIHYSAQGVIAADGRRATGRLTDERLTGGRWLGLRTDGERVGIGTDGRPSATRASVNLGRDGSWEDGGRQGPSAPYGPREANICREEYE